MKIFKKTGKDEIHLFILLLFFFQPVLHHCAPRIGRLVEFMSTSLPALASEETPKHLKPSKTN